MAHIQLKTEVPGPKSKALMLERHKQVARGPFHTTPVFVKTASGAVLEDMDGNRLIDFAAGIGVVNVGHSAPSIVAAIREQATKLIHGSINVTPYESYIRLCERLNQITPGSFAKKSFLANSGAEAVENAIKIARSWTGRPAVVCFDHAFHGRTYMAMALTSKAKPYKSGFGPFSSEIYRAPYPYSYRWPTGSNPEQVSNECFNRFSEIVNSQIGADNVAAVILEPILGEGGFIAAPQAFIKKLREFCTLNKIVLIADEIQTGFGRTGSLFACEQLGLEPDLITMAKGLGGGMPISAVTGRAEMMDGPGEGGIGGTYCGNPVAIAAALAVLDLFEKGDILTNAKTIADKLNKSLQAMAEKFPAIGEVRGMGPMLALELVKDRTTKEANPELAKKIVKYCYEHGVVIMTSGSYGNVLRFLVPLSISEEQLSEGLSVIEAAFKENL